MIPMIMSMVNETIYNKMKMKSVPIYKKLPNDGPFFKVLTAKHFTYCITTVFVCGK